MSSTHTLCVCVCVCVCVCARTRKSHYLANIFSHVDEFQSEPCDNNIDRETREERPTRNPCLDMRAHIKLSRKKFGYTLMRSAHKSPANECVCV